MIEHWRDEPPTEERDREIDKAHSFFVEEGLSIRVANALAREARHSKIDYMSPQVLVETPDQRLLSMRNLGEKGLSDLRHFLNRWEKVNRKNQLFE